MSALRHSSVGKEGEGERKNSGWPSSLRAKPELDSFLVSPLKEKKQKPLCNKYFYSNFIGEDCKLQVMFFSGSQKYVTKVKAVEVMRVTDLPGLPEPVPVLDQKVWSPRHTGTVGPLTWQIPHQMHKVTGNEKPDELKNMLKMQVINQHVCLLFSFYYDLTCSKLAYFYNILKTAVLIYKSLGSNKFRKWFSCWHIEGPEKYCSNNSSLTLFGQHCPN